MIYLFIGSLFPFEFYFYYNSRNSQAQRRCFLQTAEKNRKLIENKTAEVLLILGT